MAVTCRRDREEMGFVDKKTQKEREEELETKLERWMELEEMAEG